MATTYRKRMPSEKHYDRMRDAVLAKFDAHPSYSEEMAVEQAMEIVRQRRAADKKAIGLPSHWPAYETPLEFSEREIRTRRDGLDRDSAYRAMFIEDARAWIKAEPTWSAHEITVRITDRGAYCRYGYSWALRITHEIMSEASA